jgi:hypothetical protein
MAERPYGLVAHTAVVAFSGDRRRYFADLKKRWKALGPVELGGGSLHRSASGEGWSMKVFEEGGTHLRAMVTFPCGAAEMAAEIREVAQGLPLYPAVLAWLEGRSRGPAIFYASTAASEPARAGMVLREGVALAEVEALLHREGLRCDADELWRSDAQPDAFHLWTLMADQVNISMNPVR